MFGVNSFGASSFSASKSTGPSIRRRSPLKDLHINVPIAQSSTRSNLSAAKKNKRGLQQTDFTIFEDASAFNYIDRPASKRLRLGRIPLGERDDFANITPSPSPRLPDTPFRRSSTDPSWADSENYDPRPLTPVSPPIVEITRTRSWETIPVNGGPPPPLTPPPFDSPRCPTTPLRRRASSRTPLCAPVNKELYEVLELSEWDVSIDVIVAAYRKLVLIWHPDRVCEEEQEAATAMMKELNGAKDVLMNPARRCEYHQTGTLPY